MQTLLPTALREAAGTQPSPASTLGARAGPRQSSLRQLVSRHRATWTQGLQSQLPSARHLTPVSSTARHLTASNFVAAGKQRAQAQNWQMPCRSKPAQGPLSTPSRQQPVNRRWATGTQSVWSRPRPAWSGRRQPQQLRPAPACTGRGPGWTGRAKPAPLTAAEAQLPGAKTLPSLQQPQLPHCHSQTARRLTAAGSRDTPSRIQTPVTLPHSHRARLGTGMLWTQARWVQHRRRPAIRVATGAPAAAAAAPQTGVLSSSQLRPQCGLCRIRCRPPSTQIQLPCMRSWAGHSEAVGAARAPGLVVCAACAERTPMPMCLVCRIRARPMPASVRKRQRQLSQAAGQQADAACVRGTHTAVQQRRLHRKAPARTSQQQCTHSLPASQPSRTSSARSAPGLPRLQQAAYRHLQERLHSPTQQAGAGRRANVACAATLPPRSSLGGKCGLARLTTTNPHAGGLLLRQTSSSALACVCQGLRLPVSGAGVLESACPSQSARCVGCSVTDLLWPCRRAGKREGLALLQWTRRPEQVPLAVGASST